MSNSYTISHDHEFILLEKKFNQHVTDGSNPHGVTKGQIGLGKVENIAPIDLPLSNATQEYVDKNAVASMQVKQDFVKNEIILVLKNGNGDTIDSDPISLVAGASATAHADDNGNVFTKYYAHSLVIDVDPTTGDAIAKLVAPDNSTLSEQQFNVGVGVGLNNVQLRSNLAKTDFKLVFTLANSEELECSLTDIYAALIAVVDDKLAELNKNLTDAIKVVDDRLTATINAHKNDYTNDQVDNLIKTASDNVKEDVNNTISSVRSELASDISAVDAKLTTYAQAHADDYTNSQIDQEIAKKQDTLVSGQNIATINGKSLLSATDIVIKGTVDEEELTKAIEQVKTEVEAYTDSKITQDLVNYYTKTETYSKTQVDDLIATLGKLTVKKVASIDDVVEPGIIYLIPREQKLNNVYDEYLLIDGVPEKIGSTDIDLSGYATEDFVKTYHDSSKLDLTTFNDYSDSHSYTDIQIDEKIASAAVDAIHYEVIDTTGNINIDATSRYSYAITAKSGINSITVDIPTNLVAGYIFELNMYGYVGYANNVHIVSETPVNYVQFGHSVQQLAYAKDAYINMMFTYDGHKLICYASEIVV